MLVSDADTDGDDVHVSVADEAHRGDHVQRDDEVAVGLECDADW